MLAIVVSHAASPCELPLAWPECLVVMRTFLVLSAKAVCFRLTSHSLAAVVGVGVMPTCYSSELETVWDVRIITKVR